MTMGMIAELKKRAVIVRNGSGVHVPALTSEYSYVLTASHNLRANPKDPGTLLKLSEIEITFSWGLKCTPEAIFVAESGDAAILLVCGNSAIPVNYSLERVKLDERICILGYPRLRRSQEENESRPLLGKIATSSEKQIVVATDTFSPQSEVEGMSGSGLYKIVAPDKYVLIGVQYKMESRSEETHNWLCCNDMSVYTEILSDPKHTFASAALTPIAPIYLNDFRELLDQTFPLDGFECKTTQNYIKRILQSLGNRALGASCPTPTQILARFGLQLLVQDEPSYSLHDKKLWLSWLEFLVFSGLVDNVSEASSEYIEDLRNRRRLLYSGSDEDWSNFVRQIASSNFSGMDPDGILLIANNRQSLPYKTQLAQDLSRVVRDIATHQQGWIDIGSPSIPTYPRKVLHLDGLNADCLARRESDYSNATTLTVHELIIRLAETYRAALTI